MKNNNPTKEKIYAEIDKQIEALKRMVEERYKDATMDDFRGHFRGQTLNIHKKYAIIEKINQPTR